MKISQLLLVALILTGCNQSNANKQFQKPTGMERAKKHFADAEAQALEEPFVGVRTSKGIQAGLYPITATGVSTKPIVEAAQAFLSGLSDSQRNRTNFSVDDLEWRKWLNVDNGIYDRQGVSIKEMSAGQKALAFDLLSASLSARGMEQTRNIMRTDQTLRELNNDADHLNEETLFYHSNGSTF